MNKVISIQLAGQVLWLDEDAFEVLSQYLQQLRDQLEQNEDAQEILQDIEFRVAELLFEKTTPEKNNNTLDEVQFVIDRIGYFDSEDMDIQQPQPVKKVSFLDHEEKILGGVCAGLARRFKIPALVLRLVFVVTVLMGIFNEFEPLIFLPIIVYVILWVLLSPRKSRADVLASEGVAKTAKEFAQAEMTSEEVKKNSFQRILFLPFTIIGVIVTGITNHFKKRKSIYFFIFRTFVSFMMIVGISTLGVALTQMNYQKIMFPLFQYAFILSSIYITTVVSVFIFAKLYGKQIEHFFNMAVNLGLGIAITTIISCFIYLEYQFSFEESKKKTNSYEVTNKTVKLIAGPEIKHNAKDKHVFNPKFYINVVNKNSNEVKVTIETNANGATPEKAQKNLESILYNYTFKDNILEFKSAFSYDANEPYRNQYVNVYIDVPSGIVVEIDDSIRHMNYNWNRPFYSNHHHDYSYEWISYEGRYITFADEWTKIDKRWSDRLSKNEKKLVLSRFGDIFFKNVYYHSYIQSDNKDYVYEHYLDQAFVDYIEDIEKIRIVLKRNRTVYKHDLTIMVEDLNNLGQRYKDVAEFQQLLVDLIQLKENYKDYLPEE